MHLWLNLMLGWLGTDYEDVRLNLLTSGNVAHFRLHPLTCRIYREVSSRPVPVFV
jgi:hypothetical protein